MARITFIGAGSLGFTRRLARDILTFPAGPPGTPCIFIAAESLGVASVMLSETGRTGFYDAAYLVEKLALPAGVVPIMTVAFGYPAKGRPAMPPKLPLAAVSFTGPYREADQEVLEDWYRQQQAGYQASNWGDRFSGQIAYYNRRLVAADRDLERLVHRGLGAD